MRKEKIFTNKTGAKSIRKRLALVSLFFVAGFSAVTYRAYSLQVAPHKQINSLAQKQHKKKQAEGFGRGHIYDRSGDELAISVPSYSLVAHPHLIKEPSVTASQMQNKLGLKESSSLKKLNKKSKFVWMKRHLSTEQTHEVKKIDNKGLSLVKETRRFYPNRVLAASLLGAVGYDDRGLSGLEYYYNNTLKGSSVRKVSYRDARGDIYETGESLRLPGSTGDETYHLVLTIDRQIQFVAEKELADAVDKHGARWGTIIVMNPKSGAVLAMATYPTFNPNEYSKYEQALWKNKASATMVEPGSTFKIVTAAAALEAGLVKPNQPFFCENGTYKIGRRFIHDHDPYNDLSFSDILKFSSNIGIYKVAKEVGAKRLYDTIKKFGFSERTGIDYPGEVRGSLRPLKQWSDLDHAAISFGQGIGTTPLQIASAVSTIAAGGVRLRPFLVQKIIDEHGKTISDISPEILNRAVRKKTAYELTKMMKSVVMDGGTGTMADIPGYTVAGKTGTAQKIDSKTKTYSKTKYFSSFAGFTPADNPELVIFVGIDEPEGMTYGGQVAAPVFSRVGLASLQHLGIPPDRPLMASQKEPKAMHANLGGSLIGDALASAAGKIHLGQNRMPNLKGLSMREAATILGELGVQARIRGSGFVVHQDPPAGSELKEGVICEVKLNPAS